MAAKNKATTKKKTTTKSTSVKSKTKAKSSTKSRLNGKKPRTRKISQSNEQSPAEIDGRVPGSLPISTSTAISWKTRVPRTNLTN